MTDFTSIADAISERIFDRIEKDKSLIRQSIADEIRRELMVHFGAPVPSTVAENRDVRSKSSVSATEAMTKADIIRKAYNAMLVKEEQRREKDWWHAFTKGF